MPWLYIVVSTNGQLSYLANQLDKTSTQPHKSRVFILSFMGLSLSELLSSRQRTHLWSVWNNPPGIPGANVRERRGGCHPQGVGIYSAIHSNCLYILFCYVKCHWKIFVNSTDTHISLSHTVHNRPGDVGICVSRSLQRGTVCRFLPQVWGWFH